jgi:S-adenosylmethionine hydrolase
MIITLTTDFGAADAYVGIMKGVMLAIAHDLRFVDLSHEVPSYDILRAALVLNSAWRHFPKGSIHLVVVDPGVGSQRRPLALSAGGHIFVGPDNGVFSFILKEPAPNVYHITDTGLFKVPVSTTFHGRDIFAPVAARLASGLPPASVGPRIDDAIRLTIPIPRRSSAETLVATVLQVDKFGNIMTNLRREDLVKPFCIHVGGQEIRAISSSYAEVMAGVLFAIEGSSGYIELSLNKESAAGKLLLQGGAEIKVTLEV